MIALVLVAIGGAAGAVARYLIGRLFTAASPRLMPGATLAVNLSGSLLLGVLVAVAGSEPTSGIALALAAGFLGAYTTFSTWMIETLQLMEQNAWRAALANLLLPALTGPPAALLGLWLGAML